MPAPVTPESVRDDIYRLCATTPVIPVWDPDGHLFSVDPLTHEEATVLANVLTAYLIDHYQPRGAAA